jgi:RND family efflux transporter MFP subunit
VPDQLSSDLASLKIDRGAARSSGGGGSGGTVARFLIGVIALGAAGFGAYTRGMPYLEARFLKTEVELTEISTYIPMKAAVELTSTGYVQPQVVSRAAAKIPGRVAAVHVREGQRVEKGTLLVELDRADREAAIAAARARVSTAQARVATARANLAETRQQAERQRKLATQGVAPAATAEDLEARVASLAESVKAAEAEVKAATTEVEALRVDLDYMKIFAPISGTILTKPPEVGELAGPGGVEPVEIADFSTLMVETDIPEGRLHMVKIGSPCEITLDAFPGRRYRGEAVEVSPRVSRAKATVEVKVKFVDPAEGVLPDMAARVSFLDAPLDAAAMEAKPVTVVPAAAVVERGGAKVVFVLEGDLVRMRPVTLGGEAGVGFELREGPSVGARIVTSPPPTLNDGQRVKQKGAT